MNGVIKENIVPARLYNFERVCGATEEKEYPAEYEIPGENTGTLKNQGTIGACVACVISQIAEALYKREFGKSEEMSEGFVYGALRDENSNCEGMVVSKAVDYWHKLGAVPKKYFDILTEMPEMKKIVKRFPELYTMAVKYRIGGYAVINYADRNKKDMAIKKALTDNEYPLLAVSDDYFNEPHCIELVGWNDNDGKYKIKNSWGTAYGNNGFGEIPKTEIDAVYVIIPKEIKLPFEDIKETDWFYDVAKNMYFSEMIKGTSDTTLEPNRAPTRAEMWTADYRILKKVDELINVVNKLITEKIQEGR